MRIIKTITIMLSVCLALALVGCQQNGGADQGAKNGNGTPAAGTLGDGSGQASDSPSGGGADESALPLGDEIADEPVIPPADEVIEIREKMFVAQTNEIYYNSPDYLGKTIKYEGIFTVYDDPGVATYRSVIRYGPGCCGTDANCGFEVIWDKPYPNENDWVEAVGTLEEYEEDGYPYLRLRLSSLKTMPTRGAETVSQ
jgi:hypothetical protein